MDLFDFTKYTCQKTFESKICSEGNYCSFCQKEFKNNAGLNKHIGRMHNSNKDVECPTCSRLFRSRYALKFHRKQVHEKSTRVPCPVCKKYFYNKYVLANHLAKHSNP